MPCVWLHYAFRLNLGVRHQGDGVVNWDKIVKLALTLFLTQVVIGFLDGALSPTDAGIKWLVASAAVSFVACGAIFAVFAIRQPTKQFTHAWIALLVQVVVSFVLVSTLDRWMGSTSWFAVALEWFSLVCALIVGVSTGSALRHSFGKRADA